MKKIITLLLCILVIGTLSVGCSNNDKGEIILKKSDTELVFDRAAQKGDGKRLTSVYPFSNRSGFVMFDKRNDGGETFTDSYFGLYNMDTKELTEIGKYGPMLMGSLDNMIIMNDRYLYMWSTFLVGEEIQYGQLALLRMDILDKKLEVIETIEDNTVSPLIYMSKLNENEFIATIVYKEEENYATNTAASTTRVIKYDSISRISQTIIENKYVYTVGEAESTGILLESVCSMDNKIYAVGRRMEDSEWHYYFYTYDDEGNLLSEVEAEALAHTMKDRVTQGFYVVGSYFTLTQYETGSSALYRIDDKQVEVVIKHEENMMFSNMSNLYRSEKSPYIYYMVNWNFYDEAFQNATENNQVSALNTATGQTSSIKTTIDDERPYLDYVFIDENGNLIISLIEQKFADQPREYFVSNETLQKLLK